MWFDEDKKWGKCFSAEVLQFLQKKPKFSSEVMITSFKLKKTTKCMLDSNHQPKLNQDKLLISK